MWILINDFYGFVFAPVQSIAFARYQLLVASASCYHIHQNVTFDVGACDSQMREGFFL